MADFDASATRSMRAPSDRGGAPYKPNISAGSASFEIARGRAPGLAALMVEAGGKPCHMARGERGLP